MSNSYVKNIIHIVFHTKVRTTDIAEVDLQRVLQYIGGIVKKSGAVLMAVGGMPNHIHLLVSLSQSVALADFVRAVKSESSRWIKGIRSHYYGGFAWQEGYGAFSVSASVVPNVVNYIKNQQEHHRKKSFIEEYKEFLAACGIEYDERYL